MRSELPTERGFYSKRIRSTYTFCRSVFSARRWLSGLPESSSWIILRAMEGKPRLIQLRVPPGLSAENAVARLQDHPWVEYVEPDGIGSGGTTIPNDPDFLSQWHHQNSAKPSAAIETPQAWDITQGSSNVLVAVLDS